MYVCVCVITSTTVKLYDCGSSEADRKAGKMRGELGSSHEAYSTSYCNTDTCCWTLSFLVGYEHNVLFVILLNSLRTKRDALGQFNGEQSLSVEEEQSGFFLHAISLCILPKCNIPGTIPQWTESTELWRVAHRPCVASGCNPKRTVILFLELNCFVLLFNVNWHCFFTFSHLIVVKTYLKDSPYLIFTFSPRKCFWTYYGFFFLFLSGNSWRYVYWGHQCYVICGVTSAVCCQSETLEGRVF